MILMRHAECYNDYDNDPGLNEYGKIDAFKKAHLLNLLPNKIFTIFYSPKKRCLETFEILSAVLKFKNAVIIDELREIRQPRGNYNERAERILARYVLPNINDNNTMILSHRNILGYIYDKLHGNNQNNIFENYGVFIQI